MPAALNQNWQIRTVKSPEDRELFLDTPYWVYRQDPNWVAPLRTDTAKQLSPHHSFCEYGSLQAFIACPKPDEVRKKSNSSQPVMGRVVAAVNRRLVEKEQRSIGLFGFFECVPDLAIAKSLLDAACGWLVEQGMTEVRGPINFSTHNDCLFLVDGFDTPPLIMMPYNPPYYPQFLEQLGWHQAKDAYAYNLSLERILSEEFERAYRVASKAGIKFRSIRTKGEGFQQDCRSLYQLFTTAFSDNWSSSPRTEEEFLEEAKGLKDLVDTDIFVIAEDGEEMVGFFMALPDYNIPLKFVNGRLNWLGIVKFLWYRRQIDQARVLAICALPEYRRKMVAPALIYLGMKGGTEKKRPYRRAELSWVWEDNLPSRKIIEAAGATICKTYRIYEKSLVDPLESSLMEVR